MNQKEMQMKKLYRDRENENIQSSCNNVRTKLSIAFGLGLGVGPKKSQGFTWSWYVECVANTKTGITWIAIMLYIIQSISLISQHISKEISQLRRCDNW